MVKLEGWVNAKRIVGGIVFVELLNDNSIKNITLVFKKSEDKNLWKKAKKLKLGSAIRVEGEFVERGLSKRGVEFRPRELEVVSEPVQPLPVDPSLKTEILFDTRLNYRYLLLRTPLERAIFIIRHTVLESTRSFFIERGFIEVNTPKIVGAGAEGGATLFELNYFGKKAFLSQSPQLYKQMLMAGLTKVFEITPYFRAEKHHTTRHLNECYGIDAEIGFIDSVEDVMKVLEELVSYVHKKVAEKCKEELEFLNAKIEPIPTPFPRIKYDEAVEILQKRGVSIEWGEDFTDYHEKIIGEEMLKRGHKLYFIVQYPWKSKPFYIMREGEYSASFDLDYSGLEISSGGQREHRYSRLVENIKEKGLNPESFSFYLEAFKYGMPPHGGFGLGLERLLIKMLNKGNVREVILFPRDIQRLVP